MKSTRVRVVAALLWGVALYSVAYLVFGWSGVIGVAVFGALCSALRFWVESERSRSRRARRARRGGVR